MTYYRTNRTFDITPIEVEKADENYVWINGDKYPIRSIYDGDYHPSYEAAKEFIIAREQRIVEGLKERLAYSEQRLEQAYNLNQLTLL